MSQEVRPLAHRLPQGGARCRAFRVGIAKPHAGGVRCMSDRPWAAQLAKASWVACLVTLGVGYLGRATGLEAANVNAALGMTIVYALLLFGGFGCGIAALFGVRKFGRRAILLPALIGSTLCLLEVVIRTDNLAHASPAIRQRAQPARLQ